MHGKGTLTMYVHTLSKEIENLIQQITGILKFIYFKYNIVIHGQ